MMSPLAVPDRKCTSAGKAGSRMHKVSVVIPTFNCAAFIGEAIDSVLAQTRVPDEIIIVNDGSSDGTSAVVRRYSDPRIQYVEQNNRGISAARNRGMAHATGEFLAFLDADDRWRPTMLEKQLAILEAEPEVVCSFANFMRFNDSDGSELGDQFRYYPLESVQVRAGPLHGSFVICGDSFCGLVAFNEIPCYVQVTLLRARSIAGMTFNEDLRLGEDYEFLLRVYLRGRVAYQREILADVRRHLSNATRDYLWAPVSRLHALKSIRPEVTTDAQRRVYHDRLVKAYVDAAGVRCRRRQLLPGLRTYLEGLAVPGSYARKAKGFLRIVWEALRSLIPVADRFQKTTSE